MNRTNAGKALLWAALGLAASAAGCGKDLDLVPAAAVRGIEISAICRMDEGLLLAQVGNQGSETSRSSTTLVRFDSLPPKVLPTPPVPAGREVEVEAVLPETCLQPSGCTFQITVDGRQDIKESDEANNTFTGRCGG